MIYVRIELWPYAGLDPADTLQGVVDALHTT